jgi:hypothetical protein
MWVHCKHCNPCSSAWHSYQQHSIKKNSVSEICSNLSPFWKETMQWGTKQPCLPHAHAPIPVESRFLHVFDLIWCLLIKKTEQSLQAQFSSQQIIFTSTMPPTFTVSTNPFTFYNWQLGVKIGMMGAIRCKMIGLKRCKSMICGKHLKWQRKTGTSVSTVFSEECWPFCEYCYCFKCCMFWDTLLQF